MVLGFHEPGFGSSSDLSGCIAIVIGVVSHLMGLIPPSTAAEGRVAAQKRT